MKRTASRKPYKPKSGSLDDLLDKPVANPKYGGMMMREAVERLLTSQ